jgi:hypothetical protein
MRFANLLTGLEAQKKMILRRSNHKSIPQARAFIFKRRIYKAGKAKAESVNQIVPMQ